MEEDKENKCPYCGHEIENGQWPLEADIEEKSYYYEWLCRNCHEIFTQWYSLVWQETQ